MAENTSPLNQKLDAQQTRIDLLDPQEDGKVEVSGKDYANVFLNEVDAFQKWLDQLERTSPELKDAYRDSIRSKLEAVDSENITALALDLNQKLKLYREHLAPRDELLGDERRDLDDLRQQVESNQEQLKLMYAVPFSAERAISKDKRVERAKTEFPRFMDKNKSISGDITEYVDEVAQKSRVNPDRTARILFELQAIDPAWVESDPGKFRLAIKELSKKYGDDFGKVSERAMQFSPALSFLRSRASITALKGLSIAGGYGFWKTLTKTESLTGWDPDLNTLKTGNALLDMGAYFVPFAGNLLDFNDGRIALQNGEKFEAAMSFTSGSVGMLLDVISLFPGVGTVLGQGLKLPFKAGVRTSIKLLRRRRALWRGVKLLAGMGRNSTEVIGKGLLKLTKGIAKMKENSMKVANFLPEIIEKGGMWLDRGAQHLDDIPVVGKIMKPLHYMVKETIESVWNVVTFKSIRSGGAKTAGNTLDEVRAERANTSGKKETFGERFEKKADEILREPLKAGAVVRFKGKMYHIVENSVDGGWVLKEQKTGHRLDVSSAYLREIHSVGVVGRSIDFVKNISIPAPLWRVRGEASRRAEYIQKWIENPSLTKKEYANFRHEQAQLDRHLQKVKRMQKEGMDMSVERKTLETQRQKLQEIDIQRRENLVQNIHDRGDQFPSVKELEEFSLPYLRKERKKLASFLKEAQNTETKGLSVEAKTSLQTEITHIQERLEKCNECMVVQKKSKIGFLERRFSLLKNVHTGRIEGRSGQRAEFVSKIQDKLTDENSSRVFEDMTGKQLNQEMVLLQKSRRQAEIDMAWAKHSAPEKVTDLETQIRDIREIEGCYAEKFAELKGLETEKIKAERSVFLRRYRMHHKLKRTYAGDEIIFRDGTKGVVTENKGRGVIAIEHTLSNGKTKKETIRGWLGAEGKNMYEDIQSVRINSIDSRAHLLERTKQYLSMRTQDIADGVSRLAKELDIPLNRGIRNIKDVSQKIHELKIVIGNVRGKIMNMDLPAKARKKALQKLHTLEKRYVDIEMEFAPV